MPVYRLEAVVQNYSWGTYDVIPDLLGIKNRDTTPYAELWMGTHPAAPSVIVDNGRFYPLSEQVQRDYKKDLPFLFKVLSARQPLSIQLHPDKEHSIQGFEAEEAAKIAHNSPKRIYKDKNHKPEMLIAIKNTHALCSFRSLPEIIAETATLPFGPTHSALGKKAVAKEEESISLYLAALLRLTGTEKEQYIQAVLDYAKEKSKEAYDRYWWVQTIAKEFPSDVCCSAALFCNLVTLQPGEGLFVSPGEIHAYLSGSGVEIMATSDNVIRAGCTSKHVDVEVLLKTANFKAKVPTRIHPEHCSAHETVYPSPAEEFECSCITLSGGRLRAERKPLPEILLCYEGNAVLRAESEIELSPGTVVYISPQTSTIQMEGRAKLYRASLPGAAGLLHDD